MANPKWGTKRICQSCGAKFYDLRKSPIVCPCCGATFDPESLLKSRRSRPAPKPEAAAQPEKKPRPKDEDDAESDDDDIDLEDAEADAMLEEAGDDEDGDFIEDTSDLGDDDDMGEVVIEKEKDDT